MQHGSSRLIAGLLVAFAMVVLAGNAYAADATGTWKWSTPGRQGGQPRESTLKLKQDGEKLTGTLKSGGGQNAQEIEIKEGSVKDGTVTFKVTRTGRNNNEITITYSGKLDGDTIKGTTTTGQGQPRDWEAKRAKE